MTVLTAVNDGASRANARAFEELCQHAHDAFDNVPTQLLAEHVLRICEGGDWPVQRAAMDAILRRWAFAERDELRIASRPKESVFGRYVLKRPNTRGARPWTTVLWSADPALGACDCPDFLRSSLGLCKHLLVVLDAVCSKPERSWRGARGQTPTLRWHSIRPLTGAGDPLLGVRWRPAKKPLKTSALRRWFAPGSGDELELSSTYASDPRRRLALVDDVLSAARRQAPNVDPALLALLEHERERLVQRLDDSSLTARLPKLFKDFRRELYPYQLEGLTRFLRAGRLLLADDMGLGKTVQATAACHALFKAGKVRRGLVLVPASLKSQWLREWQAMTNVPAQLVDGGPEQREAAYRGLKSGFLIANYEQLLRDYATISELDLDMVVLDEAQRIKNWQTKTAVYVKSLTPRYRLVLTGTPLENRLEELASLLDWVDDTALAPKWRLAPWHTLWEGDGSTSGRVGARNLSTLRARLEGCTVRRVRSEVLSQLPPRTDVRVPVTMTARQLEAHDELELPIRRLIAAGARRPLTQPEFFRLMALLTRQRIASNGMAQLEFDEVWPECARRPASDARIERLCSPKLAELRRLITDLAVTQGRKVVVFSQWRKMLRLAEWSVADVLAAAGLRAVFFTGAESQKQRTESVIELHDDPATRVMFLSDAGGVGLNLQRAASSCINLELPWNPAVLEQRIGRIHRIGQSDPIDVYNLISEVGIEARISALVASKRALFSGLFDGGSDEIRFDGSASFLKQLEVLYDAPTAPDVAADAEDDAAVAEERPSAPEPVAPSSTSDAVRAALGSISVRRGDDGRLSIEAEPEAAELLLMMLEQTAALLRARS